MSERTLCAIQNLNGRDCDRPIPPDAPISLCARHLQQAYLYVRDLIAECDPDSLEYEVEPRRAIARRARPAADAPAESGECVVYYIRFGDRIKIGTTKNIWKRAGAIPHDRVLATEPGSYDLERERHEQFKDFRAMRGEWFRDCPEIRKHVNALRRLYGDPLDQRITRVGAILEGDVPWER